jgi:hypothetical protein
VIAQDLFRTPGHAADTVSANTMSGHVAETTHGAHWQLTDNASTYESGHSVRQIPDTRPDQQTPTGEPPKGVPGVSGCQLATERKQQSPKAEPCREFVLLRGGLAVPAPAINLAADLESRGFRLALHGAELRVSPAAQLTAVDVERIQRWQRHIAAVLTYEPPPPHWPSFPSELSLCG